MQYAMTTSTPNKSVTYVKSWLCKPCHMAPVCLVVLTGAVCQVQWLCDLPMGPTTTGFV